MKKSKSFRLFLIFVFCIFAFVQCEDKDKKEEKEEVTVVEYRRITADEAKEMLDKNPNAILLDVRTEAEYTARRIVGAILLTYNEIETKAADVLPDKDALILIYCRIGRRSEIASNKLISLGYTNVYDFGGINSWRFDTEKD